MTVNEWNYIEMKKEVDFLSILTPIINGSPIENRFEVGVNALLCFLQQGWTGPAIETNITMEQNTQALNELMLLGEEIYHLTPDPFLLLLARKCLVDGPILENPSFYWWRARTLFVHQKLIDSLLPTLFQSILENYSKVECSEDLKARLWIEIGTVYHYYGKDTEAVVYFQKAQKQTGLVFNVTGMLGKRTKFQQFETAQLVVTAESKSIQTKSDSVTPVNHELNHDVLLEKPLIGDASMDKKSIEGNLDPIDQTILLAFCLNVSNTNPDDGLTTTQMLPYVQRVLENPNNWMITTMALLLRSRLESKKTKTVERSCLQLQTLVDQFREQENDAPVQSRMEHFFSLVLPSKWEMEKELGKRFASIGVIRSALEIFLRLEMWEDVISCYQMLQEPSKAENLITTLLAQKETPKLLCLLGDVRGDKTLYEKAWILSGNRFARAMRSLGSYYFNSGEYQKSVDSYTKALAINPMYENSWFIMGCAALRISDHTCAISAFTRTTQIEPENSEAWNNLASVYISTKRLKEAYNCLREATKLNYDSANIWENYLFVSADLGAWSDAIYACERVFSIRIDKVKLKNNALDIPVLEKIVANVAAVQDVGLDSKLQKLFAIIEQKFAAPGFYHIVGLYWKTKQQYKKWIEYEEKSYRILLHVPTIGEDKSDFDSLVEGTLELVEAYAESGKNNYAEIPRMGEEPLPVCPDWIYRSKMAVKAVMGRSKVWDGTDSYSALADKFQELKQFGQ